MCRNRACHCLLAKVGLVCLFEVLFEEQAPVLWFPYFVQGKLQCSLDNQPLALETRVTGPVSKPLPLFTLLFSISAPDWHRMGLSEWLLNLATIPKTTFKTTMGNMSDPYSKTDSSARRAREFRKGLA